LAIFFAKANRPDPTFRLVPLFALCTSTEAADSADCPVTIPTHSGPLRGTNEQGVSQVGLVVRSISALATLDITYKKISK
jgi:hypothetical protein